MPNAESKHRLMRFGIHELPNDVNSQPDGDRYETFLETWDTRSYKSLRIGFNGVWSGRFHHTASLGENRSAYAIEADPLVLGFREGYPCITMEVQEMLEAGEAVRRNKIFTLDFVETLAPKTFGGRLAYCGVSFKNARQRGTDAGKRREMKERLFCEERGWGWRYGEAPTETAVRNYELLRGWAMPRPLDESVPQALIMARELYRTRSTAGLHASMKKIAIRHGLDDEWCLHIFATAFYMGYLALDHDVRLDEHHAPALMRPVYG